MSAEKKTTIKVYAAVPFTDVNGEHAENDIIEMPYETAAEISEVQGMVAYGVVTTAKRK